MGKTVFVDGNPSQGILGTIVNALFLNKIFNHRHDGADADGSAPINYAADTGAANAYAIALAPDLTAHVVGMPICFKAAHANTGASNIAINGMATVPIKDTSGVDLVANAIKAGSLVSISYDGVNYQVLSVHSNNIAPVGVEMLWPTETPPEGWLEEDGSSLVRATYPALFAIIGTMYGAADSTHFNLPDARGRFPRAWAHGQTTDPDRASRIAPAASGATISAGDHVGTNQVDAFKSHLHQEGGNTTGSQNARVVYGMGAQGDDALNSNTLATGGNETRPLNTNRMMIIKAY